MSNFQLIKQRPTRASSLMRTIRKFFVSAFVISTFIAYVLHERSVHPEDRVDLVVPAQKIALQTQSVAAPVQPISAPPNDDSVVGQPDSPIQVAVADITATSTAIPATATETALPTVQPIVQPTVQPTVQPIVTSAIPLPTATTEPTFTPRPTRTPRPTATPTSQSLGMYKDGDYTGVESNAYYGLVQVQVTIQSGQIANVQFLEYPNHRRTSVRINQQAAPILQSEALQVQSARVNMISGATLTSRAFAQSLQSALQQATTN